MIKKLLFSLLIVIGTTSGVVANLAPSNPVALATTHVVVTNPIPEEPIEGTNGMIASLTLHEPIPSTQNEIDKLIQETRENVQRTSSNDPEVMKNFDEVVGSWKTYYLEEKKEAASLQILLEAFTFSAYKHQEAINTDKNSDPNFLHTIRTLQILWKEGNVREINPQILALFHNIPDNSSSTLEEIEEIFGPSITRLTEEYRATAKDGKHSEEKEHALDLLSKASSEVKIVKLADRINYVQLNAESNSISKKNTQLHNFTWNIQLVHALKGANLSLETILEEAYIAQLDSWPSK